MTTPTASTTVAVADARLRRAESEMRDYVHGSESWWKCERAVGLARQMLREAKAREATITT